MKTFHEAYIEPAEDILGTAGTRIGWYRFARDLVTFATGVQAPYNLADIARNLRLRDKVRKMDEDRRAGIREQGSPFTTITVVTG